MCVIIGCGRTPICTRQGIFYICNSLLLIACREIPYNIFFLYIRNIEYNFVAFWVFLFSFFYIKFVSHYSHLSCKVLNCLVMTSLGFLILPFITKDFQVIKVVFQFTYRTNVLECIQFSGIFQSVISIHSDIQTVVNSCIVNGRSSY